MGHPDRMAPSLIGLLGRSALAAEPDCGIGLGPTGRIPFVVFDLAGGYDRVLWLIFWVYVAAAAAFLVAASWRSQRSA